MSLMMNRTGAVVHSFQNHRRNFIAGALALGVSLLIAAASSQAQTNFYWASNTSGNWADSSQWNTTNNLGSFTTGYDWPADVNNGNDANYQNDIAWWTNAGTFNVNVNMNGGQYPGPGLVNYASNMFANASNTTMNVTLSIGPGISLQPGSGSGIVIGQTQGATTIVSFVSSGGTLNTGATSSTLYIGKNGYGVLYVTNTYINARGGNWTIGDGTNSLGLLVISGTNSYVDMGQTSGGHLNVGGGDSFGHTVILSNSASLSCPNLRIGSTVGGSGSSNNLMIVDSGAELFLAGGHAVVGSRESNTAGTNTPAFNNTLIFQNHGYGDTSNHTFAVGWADNDVPTTPASTGNVLIIQSGCALTNMSHAFIRPNNAAFVYGGVFGGGYDTNAAHQFIFNPFSGDVTNEGSFTCWGTIQGSAVNASGGVMIVSNNVGTLTVDCNLMNLTGSVLQITLGSSYNSTPVGSNLFLNGKINFIDSGGFSTVGNHTYLLFTHNTTTNFIAATVTNHIPDHANTNNLTIGPVPGFPSATYTINMPDLNTVNLIVGGFVSPFGPLKITSITRTPTANDITINWNTQGLNGQFNYVQAAPGGNFSPGALSDIATITIAGATASYTDVGGAISRSNRYYRIRSPQ